MGNMSQSGLDVGDLISFEPAQWLRWAEAELQYYNREYNSCYHIPLARTMILPSVFWGRYEPEPQLDPRASKGCGNPPRTLAWPCRPL